MKISKWKLLKIYIIKFINTTGDFYAYSKDMKLFIYESYGFNRYLLEHSLNNIIDLRTSYVKKIKDKWMLLKNKLFDK